MAKFKRKLMLLFRAIALLLVFLVVFPISSPFISVHSARADGWPGWDGINTIYYNPTQEDTNNPFLQTAAGELETYLEQMSGWAWSVVTNTSPDPPAVYLVVNASLPALATYGDEAFKLVIDSNGVTITGKTALACRHGAYYLLDEKLGVRWFLKDPAFWYVPPSLVSLINM